MAKQNFKSILMKKIIIALLIMSFLIVLFSVYQRFNYEMEIKADLYKSLSSLFFDNLKEEINLEMRKKEPKKLESFPKQIENKLTQVGSMSYYSKIENKVLFVYTLEDEQAVLYKLYLPPLIQNVADKVNFNADYGVFSTLYEPIVNFNLEEKGITFYQRDEIVRGGLDYYFVASNNNPYSIYPFYLIIDLNLNLLNLVLVNLIRIFIFLLITAIITYYIANRFSEKVSDKVTQLSETAYLKGQRAVKGLESEAELPTTNIKEIDKITTTLRYLFRSNYDYARELEENHQQIKNTNEALWNVLILTEKLVSDNISPRVFQEQIKNKVNGLEEDTVKPLKNLVHDIIRINQEKQEYLEQNQELIYKTLDLLGEMSEYRDDVTGAHINRVSEIAAILGQEFLNDEEELIRLKNASKLHDLGKIAIPDDILLKPGKLTDEEYEEMKKHARSGYNILSRIEDPLFDLAAQIALTHHEKWDGSGYPLGLSGTDIPLESRIVAICDVFDALKSSRPYKEAYSFDRAFEIIKNDAGTHFDPEIVEVLMQNKDKIIEIY